MICGKALINFAVLGISTGILFPIVCYSQNSDTTDHSNIRRYQTTLVPLKTEGPTVTTTVVDISNQFLITLKNDGLLVVYKKKTLSIHSVQQLDKYLKKNLKTIDQTQICICNDNSKVEIFNEVLAVFKSNKIYHFHFCLP